ncbi:MAG: hypothetical protein K8J09_06825 [Planctomycetes bacterium]|nr:hypothetical protein [Planctomycetota bacterium]MCC7398282.1 hypothetical protein [Planctomycetota bacterium]
MRLLRPFVGMALLFVTAGCAFHSTATHWNGRVGTDGKPIFVKTTTNVGVNLLVILPLFGNTTIDTMLDETSGEIASQGSDHLRVIQTSAENYWHGFPPFTWILTPVITDVAVEYTPPAEELAKVAAEERAANARAAVRRDEDHSHLVPGEPRR